MKGLDATRGVAVVLMLGGVLLAADGAVEKIKMKMLSPDTDFSYDFHDLDLLRVAP